MAKNKIPETTAQLKKAKYNPRTITKQRLAKLSESMEVFGDLSGVVFNVTTQTLVSGHQRMTSLGDAKTKIVQKECTDKFGTVSTGHILAKTKKGEIRIPYRAVAWDINKEKAANIAANAHGGVFDKDKLKLVLADIERSKAFQVEIVGLDPLTLKSLRIKDSDNKTKKFEEITTDSIKTQHTCPKCSFKF